MSGPLHRHVRAPGRPAAPAVTRGNDLSFRNAQPACCGQSWAPAAERSGHVRGLCRWCCRAGGSPCRSPGRCGVGPRARWPGRLALAVARRAARAVCRRRGCAAAASRSSSPGGVPADLAGCAAGISRRPGTQARCLAARAWRRPASAAGARTVSRLMPATGSGRDAIHGPAPDDRPAPPPGPPGRGHDTGAAVTCAFTAMARIRRGCPGHRRSCRHGLAGLALAGCHCLLRAAVSPHRPSGPCLVFSNYTVLAGAPLRNRTVDLLLTMDICLAAGQQQPER
jgi:hypothetical protein